MLAALGAVILAAALGGFFAALVLLQAVFRGIEALADALPWALAAFILTAAAVLWGLGHA